MSLRHFIVTQDRIKLEINVLSYQGDPMLCEKVTQWPEKVAQNVAQLLILSNWINTFCDKRSLIIWSTCSRLEDTMIGVRCTLHAEPLVVFKA
jgi:hypothetical protein